MKKLKKKKKKDSGWTTGQTDRQKNGKTDL